jgi:hypothetical protein
LRRLGAVGGCVSVCAHAGGGCILDVCLLQGTWTEKLPDHLMKVYGIPKKYFLVKK